MFIFDHHSIYTPSQRGIHGRSLKPLLKSHPQTEWTLMNASFCSVSFPIYKSKVPCLGSGHISKEDGSSCVSQFTLDNPRQMQKSHLPGDSGCCEVDITRHSSHFLKSISFFFKFVYNSSKQDTVVMYLCKIQLRVCN